MTLSSSLPFDIIECIIEQIDDYPSLLQCAVVSHAFLYSGRKRLFRNIRLGYDDAGLQCARLLAILVDHPEILPHIHTFRVEADGVIQGKTFALLLRHIAEGNHLRKFVMNVYDDLSWAKLDQSVQDSFRSLFRSASLRTVCFQGRIPRDFPIQLLGISPSLKHLSIFHSHGNMNYDASDCAIQSLLPSSTQTSTARPSLESLEIMGQFASRLVKYLTHSRSPVQLLQLRELRLMKLQDEDDTSTAWEAMKVASSTLERLVWHDFSSHKCDPYRDVHLCAMKRLRAVELHGHAVLARCQWLANLLASGRMPTSIETITLVFSAAWVGSCRMGVEEVEEVFTSKEHKLDDTLALLCRGKAFPRLSAIELRVLLERSVEIDPPAREKMVGKWFPALQETGFLTSEILTTE
ncbi:hypothetical protein LshimejAT787_0900130 [Lyophyllum shimeji]|uniref:F-box domain-containing protein n=1 Tax=Lyophyllum shimeji TaxID=47721 RepID=A0A9P3PRP4_LYOSH|nr:hypothetical protein LshimejAT787_0900130 [Lyophyllum shimeji]